jgi:outer membrane receptor protein involved in Fe transport
MTGNVSARRRQPVARVAGVVALGLVVLAVPVGGAAQAPGGSVGGRVADERGAPVSGADVGIVGSTLGARTATNGTYVIENVPAGAHTVRARLIGYRSQTASVRVTAGQRVTQDFTLAADPLNLDAVVVTGTATPRTKLESSNATTVLSAADLTRAAPRSTTEILRYVPGFTRVESSGGEVNQNISMRGILGVEYVMFMEDGLPVFPTMHTFFMNADNLFRMDENIERIEVVRGAGSALFGSNTPGAIVNFINKTGGPEVAGTLKATGATGGLVRNDFNINGPLGRDWQFNLGGFYRYDHGVRDPGFPGIRGGQLKASVTHQLSNGYVRASLKYIDDRNQFILPLPFQNPSDPRYVPGFSDYGAMTTDEGNHVRVPTPGGDLVLPLDNGLRTKGYWLAADASFVLGSGWTFQNSAQVMQNNQEWNAIVPFDVLPDTAWIQGLGLTGVDSTKLYFTNVFTPDGTARVRFDTPNRLVSPSGEWHVAKPIPAFQNQVRVRKQAGENSFSAGLYFANYTQENNWFFTDILTNVADNTSFLDLLAFQGANTLHVTKNGFRNYLSLYRNATGQTTVLSPVVGASIKLGDRVRADLGFRYEWNYFVQAAENTCSAYDRQRSAAFPTACLDSALAASFDLDGNPSTRYDNEAFGIGTFRHFNRTIGDWAASVGANYALTDQTSVYLQGSRAFKLPALDEFIDPTAQQSVDAFKGRVNWTGEVGLKYASRRFGVTVNGFYTRLERNTTQGLVTISGNTFWSALPSPDFDAFGVEAEASATPSAGLSLLGSATVLKSRYATCPDSTAAAPARTCPAFTEVGTFTVGVPPVIGNLSAIYTPRSGVTLLADWHFVARRYADTPDAAAARNELPTYSYANVGVSYAIPAQGITLSADLLNVYQSKGLEEGNPRLQSGTTSDLFLARPILPRRFQASIKYQF